MTSGMVTQDAITQRPSIDGQYTEAIHSIEMNQFTNTANDNILQSTISEPPQVCMLIIIGKVRSNELNVKSPIAITTMC